MLLQGVLAPYMPELQKDDLHGLNPTKEVAQGLECKLEVWAFFSGWRMHASGH